MDLPTTARFWEREGEADCRCRLCPHGCLVRPGERGRCGVRENLDGTLVSLVYGRAIAVHLDPIEKKPLFHVLPGSRSLSVATVGCNLSCGHCQNHDISQLPRRGQRLAGEPLAAGQVVEQALRAGAQTISFTYTEPTIFWEWASDIAAAAAPRGVRCLSVTNGFSTPAALADMAEKLVAANVDLKSFRDGFYRDTCGGRLQPVLDTIRFLRAQGVWVEVTTLLIPGLNDSPAELTELAAFLADTDRAMPWHLSRFHPDNEMRDRAPTPLATIERARAIGREAGLRFVYSGNVWGDAGEHTLCPACGATLIERTGFTVQRQRLTDGGACPDCGQSIEGIWN